jgi:hypothetical protein
MRMYPFEVLNLQSTATLSEIKSAYRKLAKQYHPDINSDPEALEKFKRITRAYEDAKLIVSLPHVRHANTAQTSPKPAPKKKKSDIYEDYYFTLNENGNSTTCRVYTDVIEPKTRFNFMVNIRNSVMMFNVITDRKLNTPFTINTNGYTINIVNAPVV